MAELAGRFDAVVEATNDPAGAATALALLRRGGWALLLGISGAGRPAIDPDVVSLGQLRVQGGFAAPGPPGAGWSGCTPTASSTRRRWSPTASPWSGSGTPSPP